MHGAVIAGLRVDAAARVLLQAATGRGLAFLDVPVTGPRPQAEAGHLPGQSPCFRPWEPPSSMTARPGRGGRQAVGQHAFRGQGGHPGQAFRHGPGRCRSTCPARGKILGATPVTRAVARVFRAATAKGPGEETIIAIVQRHRQGGITFRRGTPHPHPVPTGGGGACRPPPAQADTGSARLRR
jgi:hypothetical protein